MNTEFNRATDVWQSWQLKEKELRELGGDNVTNEELRRQQYKFLSEGIYRIAIDASPHERFSLGLIRSIADTLRRQLYPNKVVRFLKGIQERFITRPAFLRSYEKNLQASTDHIDNELRALGFGEHRKEIVDQLSKGHDDVIVKLTASYTDDNRLFMADFICKNHGPGDYSLERYRVCLQDPFEGPGFSVTLDPRDRITDIQAFNLLEGRSVCIADPKSTKPEGTWLRLDRHHPPGYESNLTEVKPPSGFDLASRLAELQTITSKAGLNNRETLETLRLGGQLSLEVRQGQRYLFEAAPRSGNLKIIGNSGENVKFADFSRRVRERYTDQQITTSLLRPSETVPSRIQPFEDGRIAHRI